MGIVLGVEAAVGVAEAVEAGAAAAEAGEAVAGAAEAGEAISAGADAGAEAGAEAGADAGAAAAEGGEALSQIVEKIGVALQKIGKMVAEYVEIDAVCKTAKAILEAITSDPAAKARAEKLAKLIDVLTKCSSIMQEIYNWLKEHSNDKTTLQGIEVPLTGVLSVFLPKLGAASGVLQTLSKQIAAKNLKKDPVTDGEVDALRHGLDTVAQSFQALDKFKNEHSGKVPLLASLPIDDAKVSSITGPLSKM